MKVKLRKKKISNGMASLYLDFYPPILHPDTGKLTRREFLKIYIHEDPSTPLERSHNSQMMLLGQNVCAKRIIEVQNQRFNFLSENRRNGNFLDFFKNISARKSGGNADSWEMGWRYFEYYAGEELRFIDLNEDFCLDYKDFLLSSPSIREREKGISINTAVAYFGKFRSVLRSAYKNDLTHKNLYEIVSPIKEIETHREFLTIEEIQKLADTSSPDDLMRRATLFAGLTGLRFSDIKALRWNDVYGEENNYYIQFRQQKTDGAENLPISDEAFQLLGKQDTNQLKIFHGLKYSRLKPFLTIWLANAGIKKHITFHCMRHTFATLQLSSGTDIYTVSKMLGHKNVVTTQRYTKVIDQKKREAVRRVKLKF
jgi:integrase